MRLDFIEAWDFLSFEGRARVDVGPGLTLVAGPNGAGKSNIGRCLDVARAVIGRECDDPGAAGRLDLYGDAGYEGKASFVVRIGIFLDLEWERDLVWLYVRAILAAASRGSSEDSLEDLLVWDSVDCLTCGVLVVSCRVEAVPVWSAAWEFSSAGKTFHVALADDEGNMAPGTAQSALAGARSSFTSWITQNGPLGDGNRLNFAQALENINGPVSFRARWPHDSSEVPLTMRQLSSVVGMREKEKGFHLREEWGIGFERVLWAVLRDGVVLTENRRLPLRQFFAAKELRSAVDLRDGAAVAGELLRLMIGEPEDQARYREVQSVFAGLTGRKLEVRSKSVVRDGVEGFVVEPVVAGRHGYRPVELSGAGIQEALVLSVLLESVSGRVVVLDEPAVNLEPTVQRRLVGRVRGPGQFVVITHNADLVPFEELDDRGRIVRVAPGETGSLVFQPSFEDGDAREQLRQLKLLEPAEVRGLLFAAGVVLCEGPTEAGALPRWWRDAAASLRLPDPGAANVPVVSVGGDAHFGPYLRFLEAFGVPWSVVADGPALREGSQLAEDLERLGSVPEGPRPGRDDFGEWCRFWERGGVFTLADRFGDDGSKAGEFEAFLARLDEGLLAQARSVAGRSKPRIGAYFAMKFPEVPEAVRLLYGQVAARLGIGSNRPSA